VKVILFWGNREKLGSKNFTLNPCPPDSSVTKIYTLVLWPVVAQDKGIIEEHYLI
jgi:hypothetical protein